ncbi:MAG: hypothetical protein V3V78_00750 [Candidatus Woesearchaeota archaeon]
MKTMFNFGDPHKDFTPVADEILGEYEVMHIPITNNRIFYNDEFQIVDAAYGPSLVLDSLTMMKETGRLKEKDEIMFLGSMGSLSDIVNLDDLVVPVETHCAYFGNKGKMVKPDSHLLSALRAVLHEKKEPFVFYVHGSVFAVFDPATDHVNYTNSLYGGKVEGIDCSESYIGLKFCEENDLMGAVLLYCSDDPKNHIGNISKEEFDKRALEKDLNLHRISKEVLRKTI